MARLFLAATVAAIALTGLTAAQCSNEEAKRETAPAEQPAPAEPVPAPEQPPAQ